MRAASGAQFVLYTFTTPYDTQVTDLSGNNNHGVKPAIGTSAAVNTPYGLYLEGATVTLPPNSINSSASTSINSQDKFSLSLFVRHLTGVPGDVARELITLKAGSTTRLQLRQGQSVATANPLYELEVKLGSGSATTYTSGTYTANRWFLFAISINSGTDLKICIQGQAGTTVNHPFQYLKDTTDNYLGGSNTRMIVYSFSYEDIATGCSTFDNLFDTGGSCRDVCYQGGGIPCNVDSYTYSSTCADCGATCGTDGCVSSSPVTCNPAVCPPTTFDDASCQSCYNNSEMNPFTTDACSCKAGYTHTTAGPLTCTATCTPIEVAYSNNQCSACYPHSSEDALTCKCDEGYFNSDLDSLVCIGKC
jgi:hypothetical protein